MQERVKNQKSKEDIDLAVRITNVTFESVFFSFHELMQFIHSSKKFRIKLVAQILHLKSLLFSFTEALCMFIQNTFL